LRLEKSQCDSYIRWFAIKVKKKMHRDAATPRFSLKGQLRVVLVAPRNPLNIGAAARAMANFGCTRLRVVNPYEVAFREARSAVGAAPLLASAEEFTTVGGAVADCALVVGTTSVGHRELQHPLRPWHTARAACGKPPDPWRCYSGRKSSASRTKT
jgi:hypothetical protein